MVGWGFAFGRGFVILLWSIVWAIVAGIIAVLITGGTLASIASNPTGFASNPNALLGLLGTFFLGIFLGVFVAVVGLYASIVKVTVDGALSQLEKSGRLDRMPSSLGAQPTLTSPSSARKFCPNCGTTLPGGITRCPSCGAAIW
jgi:hypothetical protein